MPSGSGARRGQQLQGLATSIDKLDGHWAMGQISGLACLRCAMAEIHVWLTFQQMPSLLPVQLYSSSSICPSCALTPAQPMLTSIPTCTLWFPQSMQETAQK